MKPLPDPLGRKSRPTMLSSTEDLPELCFQLRYNKSEKQNGNST